MNCLQELKTKFSWPAERPNVPLKMDKGWFCGENMAMIRDAVTKLNPVIVVEMGSWLGLSTRYICDLTASDCTVIAIDHWEGSSEHKVVPEWAEELPTLYETFLANCWDFRNKLVPVRLSTTQGLKVLKELNVVPQLVYLDAAHDADSVEADLTQCLEYFPNTHIIGDDWTWDSVREGVKRVLSKQKNYNLRTDTTCYEIFK